jgi:hypothetical protein
LNYIKFIDENMPILSICYLDSFDYIAIGMQDKNNNGKISIWSLKKLKSLYHITENKSGVKSLLWDQNKKEIFSCHENGNIEYNLI